MNNEQTTPDTEIDRLIHEPARLKIMLELSLVLEADFRYLLFKTKLSRGNLSVQLQKLEAAGYIEIEKTFVKRVPRTVVWITSDGKKAFRKYKDHLVELLS
ncbi:MAG: transcriptional regulator [Candidatus Cloacimonadota bacterium]